MFDLIPIRHNKSVETLVITTGVNSNLFYNLILKMSLECWNLMTEPLTLCSLFSSTCNVKILYPFSFRNVEMYLYHVILFSLTNIIIIYTRLLF